MTTITTSTVAPAHRAPATTGCSACAADLLHCHDVSIEHADGSTTCFDPGCDVPHHDHEWQLPCSALDPPCPCVPEEGGGGSGVEIDHVWAVAA
jgi:hypothetical protein